MSQNYYDILEIKSNATKEEIKLAYKKLARKFHPDVNKAPDAEKRFKEINSAADILLDEIKRRQYDISMGFNKRFEEQKEEPKKENGKDEPVHPNKTRKTILKFDFKKFINNLIKEYYRKKAQEKINGKDIYMEVKISPQEAVLGCERKINIIRTDKCPKCHGRRFVNETICPECSGVGEKIIHNKIRVKIPERIKNNTKIKLRGEGNKGLNGGLDGDLYLTIKIAGSENNIKEIFITPSEALFGTTIDIKPEDGCTKLTIPPNTVSGQIFQVADKNNKEIAVQVIVKIPKELSEEEKKLYKKLSEYDINRNREELF